MNLETSQFCWFNVEIKVFQQLSQQSYYLLIAFFFICPPPLKSTMPYYLLLSLENCKWIDWDWFLPVSNRRTRIHRWEIVWTKTQDSKFSMRWAEDPLDWEYFRCQPFTWAPATTGKRLMRETLWGLGSKPHWGWESVELKMETRRMLPGLGVFNTFPFLVWFGLVGGDFLFVCLFCGALFGFVF